MKKFYLILTVVVSLSLTSCFSFREYPVEYDYNYLGDFKNYPTFSFISKNQDDLGLSKEIVEATVKNYMEVLGYKYDDDNPTFRINYFYMSDTLSYKGYEQPEMLSFVKIRDDKDKKKEEYKEKKHSMNSGTFVISFIEQENYSMIWQGYTTDLYKEDIQSDPRKTRVAVLSILKNYVYLPDLN
ncbi:hypothetical protein GCM10027429_21020 [Marivirga atlantica]|jgi:hypothetical protein|uniref:DUF4136 domain-containing protein n=1 Tax=Marivirga atlantica TaxID=1548457 RepID=A0A937AFU6_9BACT|nr:DUF4136 domain-containing protein [Marivirga atlantica]MBL0765719.1 DUF4136 domain-containing protein [Marivirga atlantica]